MRGLLSLVIRFGLETGFLEQFSKQPFPLRVADNVNVNTAIHAGCTSHLVAQLLMVGRYSIQVFFEILHAARPDCMPFIVDLLSFRAELGFRRRWQLTLFRSRVSAFPGPYP